MKYLLKRYWIVICIALIINIPLLVVGTVRTDHEITTKGGTMPVNNVIEVNSNYEEKGSFSSLYVTVYNRTTIFQNWISSMDPVSEHNELGEYQVSLTRGDSQIIGKLQYNNSINKALIVAYTRAMKVDSKVNIDYERLPVTVTYYKDGSPLKSGDQIIKVNDISYTDWVNYATEYNKRLAGTVFTILRNNEEFQITITEEIWDLFYILAPYSVNFETLSPSVKINTNSVGGPSGGLLQTLSIYNKLIEEDITKGYKISGTGTINMNGTVGPIGGEREKVATAIDNDVDIFFCPSDNAKNAYDAYLSYPGHEKMEFVIVETFDDALEYLRSIK
ncbi:MAG: hypothetical protein IJY14_02455 [Acholeplasmatales bacterium]|nr:hypothetical protein [Acholeplasmatales bacterium]